MNELKLKKIILASTVGAVLLLVFLLSIMVYQLISIKVKKDDEAYLTQKIAEYEALIAEGEETFNERSMREWIEREARRLGYVYNSNK